jgi:hypothetical protein
MDSKDQKPDKDEPQATRDLEEGRRVIEEYIADLRALLDKLRRMFD